MRNPYGAQSYIQTKVTSASPLELVVMLYDAGIDATESARRAMIEKDIPARRTALSKAMAIIAELQSTLDVDKGGKVAVELDSIYTYAIKRLLDAVSEQSPKPIEEVHRLLGTLRDAWQQIATQPARELRPTGTRG